MEKYLTKIIVAAVSLVLCVVLFVVFFDIKVIRGNEVGVMETYMGGVSDTPLSSRTYFVLPWERLFSYSTAVQVFVMNDDPNDSDPGVGREEDSYLVQSSDSQDMHLSMQTQWRIDPQHVVNLHQSVGPEGIEERILRPVLLRLVKDEATTRQAIVAYSGAGLVDLQQSIEKKLNDENGELRQRGVIVDSFVIEHIRLDTEYVREITARQVAVQKELRAKQEEKAAVAEAAKVKAVAQADYEKRVVEAERDKAVAVLGAEAENQKEVLAAEAEKKKTVLAAEAEKESGELKASAILAIGKATAEAKSLEFTAYGAKGAEVYAQIQVANSMGNAFSGIKGYLPENMSIYTLGESFQKAVDSFVKPTGQKTQ